MMMTYEAVTRWATDSGHWVRESDWQHDSPTPGRAVAVCRSCKGTIEIREDGSVAWPGLTPDCQELLRAIADEREGISDYYAEIDGAPEDE